jgi:hypothetical protein
MRTPASRSNGREITWMLGSASYPTTSRRVPSGDVSTYGVGGASTIATTSSAGSL